MPKVPITTSKLTSVSSDPQTGSEIIANSTPLVKTLADRIISFYNEPAPVYLSPQNKRVQNLFDTWVSNPQNEQLAKLVEAMTGFAPKLKVNQGVIKIGQLFKYNSEIYVVVFLNGSTVYAINRQANKNATLSSSTNIGAGTTYAVDLTEAGLFAKDLLAVKGEDLLSYLHNYISSSSVYPLIKDLNTNVV